MFQDREAVNRMSLDFIYTAHRIWREGRREEEKAALNLGEVMVDNPHPKRTIYECEDNGVDNLSDGRFLRQPLAEPSSWYMKVPQRRLPVIRTMPGLAMSGGLDQIPVKTLELMHNRLIPLKLKHYHSGNLEITAKAKT